jgi:hypothetical protein
MQNPAADTFNPPSFSQKAEAAAQETQLKASRDVRCHAITAQLGLCFTSFIMEKLLDVLNGNCSLKDAYISNKGTHFIL